MLGNLAPQDDSPMAIEEGGEGDLKDRQNQDPNSCKQSTRPLRNETAAMAARTTAPRWSRKFRRYRGIVGLVFVAMIYPESPSLVMSASQRVVRRDYSLVWRIR